MQNTFELPLEVDAVSTFVFVYDSNTQKVVYVNQPHLPGFDFQSPHPLKGGESNDWVRCLSLREGEEYDFVLSMESDDGAFAYHVRGRGLPAGNILIIMESKGNKNEYAAFTDLAVHDLDAPLRQLGVLIERLTTKYADHEKEEVQGYVRRITNNLAGMRSMIKGLDELSS